MKALVVIFIGLTLLSIFLFVQWTEELSKSSSMQKIKGYIKATPQQQDSWDRNETNSQLVTRVKINGEWYFETDVWVPGIVTEEVKPVARYYTSSADGKCINCGMKREAHVFYKLCPINEEEVNR